VQRKAAGPITLDNDTFQERILDARLSSGIVATWKQARSAKCNGCHAWTPSALLTLYVFSHELTPILRKKTRPFPSPRLIFGSFTEICRKIKIPVKVWQQYEALDMRNYAGFCSCNWLDWAGQVTLVRLPIRCHTHNPHTTGTIHNAEILSKSSEPLRHAYTSQFISFISHLTTRRIYNPDYTAICKCRKKKSTRM
jgi:hypothetical protein